MNSNQLQAIATQLQQMREFVKLNVVYQIVVHKVLENRLLSISVDRKLL
jgi:hypothetical protein